MENKNKIKIINISFYVITYSLFLCIGFVLGMIFQQQILKQSFIEVLEYSNIDIEVNFNETKLVYELNKTIVEPMKEQLFRNLNRSLEEEQDK